MAIARGLHLSSPNETVLAFLVSSFASSRLRGRSSLNEARLGDRALAVSVATAFAAATSIRPVPPAEPGANLSDAPSRVVAP